jgi:mRNA interferase MazF
VPVKTVPRPRPIDLLLGTGGAAAIDAAIVAGYERSPASERDPWAFQAAVAAFLVLTRQATIPVLNALLAVPATRTIRQIPTEVVLDAGDGMPEECALSLDNLTLVPKELFRTRITRLSVERMSEVCRALSLASGCG